MKFVANRSFIVVKPKAPFVKWVNDYEEKDEDRLDEKIIYANRTIYMIEEIETGDEADAEKFVKKHCKEIFSNELFEWLTDLDYYPSDMSFKVFKEWFDYEYIEMCFDTLKSKVEFDD
ncbi:MAG: hypothetical protein JXR90_04075 [Spirochaetes bacterium]|nr:hypothetical protein [Spirochaetota bacterium]